MADEHSRWIGFVRGGSNDQLSPEERQLAEAYRARFDPRGRSLGGCS